MYKRQELNQISGCSGVKTNDTGECNEKENDEITDDQGVNSKITNNYEGIINEVGVSYENKLTSNNSKIVENEIYKSNTMKMNSDHDNIGTVIE